MISSKKNQMKQKQVRVTTDYIKVPLHKKCPTQTSTSPYMKNSSSQLFQKFKSFTSSTSPLQKYHFNQKDLISTVSHFTIEKKQKQSETEQKEAIDRLLKWGKRKQSQIKEKQQKFQYEEGKNIWEKPKLSKETLKIFQSGLKHHQELNNFIKFKDQFTQRSSDYPPLQKLDKLKRGVKIVIEVDEEIEDQPDDINDKTQQFKCSNEIQSDTTGSLNREIRSKSDYTSMPIHLRYEYEIKLKNAKLKQKIDEKEKVFQQELELKKKYNSTAEQFEHFLSEQENFLKKKQQFYDSNLKKELEKIQEIDSQFSYKPEINFPPQPIKVSKNKQQDEKFNEKLHTLRERQQRQKNIYLFKSTLPDLRRNIKQKYYEILHKNEFFTTSQVQYQTES
ncbi:unnamed protein product (macronuclear) [Paramecium tetraurelia]|uniref:WW domain-containing protein n=1 Tax=Paramecium tetraurelia TaxID=5888 RepID=A0EEW9_PARTE|nr:uncharacterized protein GSPATT00026183001 [Paramecium tetraurelia]CAK93860.1 unnamed protein product [Paramecium tetraurelia]|eukprot:XP_001461233.1 hypothetical protein (macronuclear) [Paramecium tetraurelia strain d4-2]